MRTGRNKLLLLVAACIALACQHTAPQHQMPKIKGVNFVAPHNPVDDGWARQLRATHVEWAAVIPYAFSRKNQPRVYYSGGKQWWGETIEGVKATIGQAKKNGIRVMLKPQVWMPDGWIGDFDLQIEAEWETWEQDYSAYIMIFARLAASTSAEALCIGTEYRTAVRKRPAFWKKLIAGIRKIYKGKLTYCANWDDYQQVLFWTELDFIGMSGYFPLSESITPQVDELIKTWKPVKARLGDFAGRTGKPIVFIEMGYRNIDRAAWRSWEMEYRDGNLNPAAQANAYEAFFKSVWHERWFGGALIWKWYDYHDRIGTDNNDWTPQGKPAEEVIKRYFGKDQP